MRSDLIAATRIALVPLVVGDAAEMVQVLSEPALYAFTGGRPPTLAELQDRYARQVVGHSADGQHEWHNWIIRRLPDQAAVGYVQATIAAEGRLAEIAWVVGSKCQGQGYAKEAATALVGWLQACGVSAIQAHIHPDHAASAAVARHAGLIPTGQLQDGEQLWVARPNGPRPARQAG